MLICQGLCRCVIFNGPSRVETRRVVVVLRNAQEREEIWIWDQDLYFWLQIESSWKRVSIVQLPETRRDGTGRVVVDWARLLGQFLVGWRLFIYLTFACFCCDLQVWVYFYPVPNHNLSPFQFISIWVSLSFSQKLDKQTNLPTKLANSICLLVKTSRNRTLILPLTLTRCGYVCPRRICWQLIRNTSIFITTSRVEKWAFQVLCCVVLLDKYLQSFFSFLHLMGVWDKERTRRWWTARCAYALIDRWSSCVESTSSQ